MATGSNFEASALITTGDPPDLTGGVEGGVGRALGSSLQCIGNCLGTVSGTKQLWQRECAGACTTHVDVRERVWHVQPTWEKTWPVGDGVYVSSCDGHGDGPMALGWACRFDRGRSWRSGRTTGGQPPVIIRRNVLDGICRIVLSRGGIVRSDVGSSFR